MPEFGINFIRGSVVPRPRRQVRYWAMIGYLGAAGATLAVSLAFATSWVMQAMAIHDDLARSEQQFAILHPVRPGIDGYAAWLEKSVSARVDNLKTLDRLLADAPQVARLTYHLVLTLPAGVTLRRLSIDAAEQVVTFDLLATGLRADTEPGPSELLARWKQNKALSAHMVRITHLGSTRQMNGERNDAVWRFSGQLAGKGL